MNKYYIYENDQQIGPLSAEQLRGYPLTLSSRIWCEDMPDWGYVKDRPEIVAALNLTNTEKRPALNAMMVINVAIQFVVTFGFSSTLEEYDMGETATAIFMGIFIIGFILNLISFYVFYQRNYRLARILSIIACIPYIPIGMIGVMGMNKAIEKATDNLE